MLRETTIYRANRRGIANIIRLTMNRDDLDRGSMLQSVHVRLHFVRLGLLRQLELLKLP